MKKVLIILSILSLIFISGCNNNAIENNSDFSDITAPASTKIGTILFFLFPDGAPCKAQKEILNNEIIPAYKDKYTFKYIRSNTTEGMSVFNQYGIRSIPAIIVLDNNNQILHRFTPGVRTLQEIKGVLNIITP